MIVFDGITKVYKSGHTALNNLSFQIDSGEFVFLMGPSGSGKTTLLRLILREIEPSEGKIIVAEHDLSQLPGRKIPLLRRQIGAAFQDFKLITDKSAFENVSVALEILGKPYKEIVHITQALLERVGLADKMHLYPSQLSGGEIQRVAIARAIATDPVLLFADEPTGNLDPETSADIINLLEEINATGTTIIMATHDVAIANQYPHRQITLNKGELSSDTKKPDKSTSESHHKKHKKDKDKSEEPPSKSEDEE